MKAARLVGPRRFEIMDTPTPAIKPGELLIKVEHLSICGSDMLTYDRVFPEEEYPLRPGMPCHECSGTVAETTDDRFKVGQRVVALHYGGCLSEYVATPAERCVPVPDSVAPELAVLCQPVGTVIYAVQKLGSVLGKSVAILGQGPIGLGFTDLLSRAGASQVIVSDVIDNRLELAKKIGATHTVNANNEDMVERVREITGGAMADITVEACGLPITCNQVFQALKMKGTTIIFGMPHAEPVFPFDWYTMYNRLPNILVTNSARAGEVFPSVVTCVDLVAKGRLDLSYLVTHHVPFDEVGKAYEMFSRRTDGAVKIRIDL